jgi:hypothetical protein
LKNVSVLIALALVLALAVGCSPKNVNKSEAKRQMADIAKAAVKFDKDYERPATDIEEMIETKYVTINASVRGKWEFELVWPDKVYAYSTDLAPVGEGVEMECKISH